MHGNSQQQQYVYTDVVCWKNYAVILFIEDQITKCKSLITRIAL